jgi:hypothetical protein
MAATLLGRRWHPRHRPADRLQLLQRPVVSHGRRLRPRKNLIVTSTRLTARARMAEAEAARLDERQAPQRERARQKKEAADAHAAREKARLANKATFIP